MKNKADKKNMKLTQYLVRLNFDGLKEPKRSSLHDFGKVVKNKAKRRKLDPDHPDFDSEEEYGEESEGSEDDEEGEAEISEAEEEEKYKVK